MKEFFRYNDIKKDRDADAVREPRSAYIGGSSAEQIIDEKYPRQGEYTIDDLFAFREAQDPDDNTRLELIDGVIYELSSPNMAHQEIVGYLLTALRNFIDRHHGRCHAWTAPLDTQIIPDDFHNMLQPDVLVVCDNDKLSNGRWVLGAPDLVVEVLSPSTRDRDMGIKLWKYHQAGVREYWIVDPEKLKVTVFDFVDDDISTYTFDDKVPVLIYDGKFVIDFADIYRRISWMGGVGTKKEPR